MGYWIGLFSLLLVMLSCWPSNGLAESLRVPLDRYKISDWEPFRNHQGFYPYLCEMGYRTLADHVIDPNHTHFDPTCVKLGDILYVAMWYLDWFVKHVHDKIQHPYILVTCDVGAWIPSPKHLRLVYDPKVVYWFAKNMLFTNHPKLFQLPMGQAYYLWAHSLSQVISTLNALVASPQPKDIFLYLNYTERPHGRRTLIADKFYDQPYCFNRNRPRQSTGFEQYWQEVARSKFVLSPLGLEVDCTRTWECFILGAIPVVEHSFLDPLYDGLPILLIHNWDEVNEEFLSRKYAEIHNQSHHLEKAYLDYWAELLHEKQDQIRRGHLRNATLEINSFTDFQLGQIAQILSQQNKSSHLLIYRGNLTCLRAFQLGRTISTLPKIRLYDLWCEKSSSFLERFSADPSLICKNRVKICSSEKKDKYMSTQAVTYFLDLTHFRHSLFSTTSELNDFSHSLEQDIQNILYRLYRGSLLMGNQANDTYVREVINRLQTQAKLNIHIQGEFWYCTK